MLQLQPNILKNMAFPAPRAYSGWTYHPNTTASTWGHKGAAAPHFGGFIAELLSRRCWVF